MDALENTPDRDVPVRPIRYGTLDILASIVLFGIHFGCLKSLLENHAPFRDGESGVRMAAAAVLCAAFAFGAAYLAFRFATTKKITSFPLRMVALVVIDAGLIALPFVFGILIQVFLEWHTLILCVIIASLVFASIIFWRSIL